MIACTLPRFCMSITVGVNHEGQGDESHRISKLSPRFSKHTAQNSPKTRHFKRKILFFLGGAYSPHSSRPKQALAAWCSGYRRSSHERSYPTAGPVSTGMGDRLWTGIPSRYVVSQLSQLSLASLRVAKSSTSFGWGKG